MAEWANGTAYCWVNGYAKDGTTGMAEWILGTAGMADFIECKFWGAYDHCGRGIVGILDWACGSARVADLGKCKFFGT